MHLTMVEMVRKKVVDKMNEKYSRKKIFIFDLDDTLIKSKSGCSPNPVILCVPKNLIHMKEILNMY